MCVGCWWPRWATYPVMLCGCPLEGVVALYRARARARGCTAPAPAGASISVGILGYLGVLNVTGRGLGVGFRPGVAGARCRGLGQADAKAGQAHV